ncbi:outer membrane beta-barrel protein [Sunxiuqinia indica]|uniref:outer membrane beta-barrel protein n=1 Tax=Sunxiuqinia indica TaxID=2692584 RepID=UPI00135A46FF|nr:outer membrane beta-barrel protein [Sunxiuqinia indica]
MKKNNDQLDELFRSKLENFEQEPPSYIWSRIQEQQTGAKRRAIFGYLKAAGIAAAVLLAFLLGWQLQHSHETDVPVLTEQNEAVERSLPKSEEVVGDESTDELNEVKDPVLNQEAPIFAESDLKNDETQIANNEEARINTAASYSAIADASKDERQIANSGNRKQETKSFSLLRLIGVELDDSFKKQARLVETNRNSQTESLLSQVELSMIEENARLLAANKQNVESAGWQVGAMLTPGFAVSQSSQSKEYASAMTYDKSSENLNVGGGISVEYKTNKRWSVQSGVFYSKLGQTSSNQAYRSSDLFYSPASPTEGDQSLVDDVGFFNTAVAVRSGEVTMNTAAGVIAIENLPTNAKLSSGFESADANRNILLTETEFEQDFEYIEIPLIFRYQLVDAVFKMQLLGGFNTSVLVGNEAYANSQDGRQRIGETRDMNSVNYSTSFGLGFGYGITDKISVRIEPQVKHFLGSLNSNSSVDYKPYTVGVFTGLTYEF